MARAYAMTLQLRDAAGVTERYRAEHAQAWPEVIAGLRDAGIRELRIFLLGRRLFMYMQGDDDFDPARDLAGLEDDPRCREWDELMRSLQEPVADAEAGEWWAAMEEVFDLNWPQFGDRAVP
jgi:L-rhamnose mutarotase